MNELQIAPMIKIINQIFDLEKKLQANSGMPNPIRNFERIRENLSEMGITIHNPLGETFSDTRTDCEASIAGDISNKLVITEVIKPIIFHSDADKRKVIIQRGIVIVQSK